jgi:hypothetical protein
VFQNPTLTPPMLLVVLIQGSSVNVTVGTARELGDVRGAVRGLLADGVADQIPVLVAVAGADIGAAVGLSNVGIVPPADQRNTSMPTTPIHPTTWQRASESRSAWAHDGSSSDKSAAPLLPTERSKRRRGTERLRPVPHQRGSY